MNLDARDEARADAYNKANAAFDEATDAARAALDATYNKGAAPQPTPENTK